MEAKLSALPHGVTTTFVPNATADGEGRFELILPPETRDFDLVVQAPGFPVASGRVTVQENKTLTLTLDQIGGVLEAEIPRTADAVLRHAGAELPARWLSTLAGGSTQPLDEAWELVRLPNMEAGEYSLCASGRCRTGFITPQGTLRVSLRVGRLSRSTTAGGVRREVWRRGSVSQEHATGPRQRLGNIPL